ncbi:MAG: hypothetical protein ACFCU7_01355 [Pleurocapsa sp.]
MNSQQSTNDYLNNKRCNRSLPPRVGSALSDESLSNPEFLMDWTQIELSTGTIDRCIREVGIACVPVVEKLAIAFEGE